MTRSSRPRPTPIVFDENPEHYPTRLQGSPLADALDRRARLRVESARGTGRDYFVKLTAGNGETLGTGETHPEIRHADASRVAWLAAMIEVLEDEGFTVLGPDDVEIR